MIKQTVCRCVLSRDECMFIQPCTISLHALPISRLATTVAKSLLTSADFVHVHDLYFVHDSRA